MKLQLNIFGLFLLEKFTSFLVTYLKIQCVATLISLPILVYWGLPLSIMSVIGNFIFTPILTLFLLLSSLLFFTELIGIPNSIFADILTIVHSVWCSLLALGKKQWLFGFVSPPSFCYLLVGISIIVVFYTLPHIAPKHRLRLLACTMLAHMLLFYSYSKLHIYLQKAPNQVNYKKLTIQYLSSNRITIIDNGFFSGKGDAKKIVNFELKPYMLQTYGTTDIHSLCLSKPGIGSFTAALQLCKTCRVNEVVLPYFKKKLTKQTWRHFFILKEYLKEHAIDFKRTRQ